MLCKKSLLSFRERGCYLEKTQSDFVFFLITQSPRCPEAKLRAYTLQFVFQTPSSPPMNEKDLQLVSFGKPMAMLF